MRVIVCGGRDYADREKVFSTLDKLCVDPEKFVVIQGGARGADALAKEWALNRKTGCVTFTADWRNHGLSAGPRRNAMMLRAGRPDMVLAFPGGPGTADMVKRAREAAVIVVEVGA